MDGCITSLVRITGTLADISRIRARVFSDATLHGHISLPKSVSGEAFLGPYEVIPSTTDDIILETKRKTMTDDVTVFKIPYYETMNTSGYTVYIGSEV